MFWRFLVVFGHFEAVFGRQKSAPGFLRLSVGCLRYLQVGTGRAHTPHTFFALNKSAKYLKIMRILTVFGHFLPFLAEKKVRWGS